MRKQILVASVFVLGLASAVGAQTKPTQAEIDQWKKETGTQILEGSVCKKITWLLESERNVSGDLTKQPIRYALGWWGRGFIEGAVYMIPGDQAQKKAAEFGLSVEVVAAHIAAYCYDHEKERPFDALQDLLLKVLK